MSRPAGAPLVDYAALVEDFNDTRPTHGGRITLAAHRLGIDVGTLEMRLRRARALGYAVRFEDDVKGWK
jgi:hypothetical protein